MPKAKKKTTGTKSKSGGSKKQKLDVPVLTEDEKRVVLIQYEKENDSEGAEALLTEYLKFMQLKIGEQGTNDKCAPSDRIDEMWHGKVFHDDGWYSQFDSWYLTHLFLPKTHISFSAHILSTKEYFAFCERHNDGNYIHHDPSMMDVPSRYETTMQRYQALFGSFPKDQTIWPRSEIEPIDDEYDNNVYEDDFLDTYGCG